MGKIRIIGGKWRGRHIEVPEAASLRPTPDRVRETLFNWLMHDIAGAYCLDLFAGTGALGFEALSRGASHVIFVEQALHSLSHLRQVAHRFQCEQSCDIVGQDAIAWLNKAPQKTFDIIFLDPPFGSTLLQESIAILSQSSLVGSHTLLYIESNHTVADGVPASWQILKEKKAGDVFYHLLLGGKS